MKKKKAVKATAPAVHIAPEHQSAPKEHWADKEVQKAADEINSGQFKPTIDVDDFLAVGLQRGMALQNPALMEGAQKLDLIDKTRDSAILAQHPRVQEALAKLAQEKREAKNSQEYAEKAQMLHEMNARAAQANMWDGQGRWIGADNEAMRIVNVMQPIDFLKRLEKFIGEGRVFLNRFAVYKRVALLCRDPEVKARIIIPGAPQPGANDDICQVGTLQYPCGPEWMVMRFDDYGIPTVPKYLGWRTALLSMIKLHVITEKEAHKAFPLSPGPASAWYREQLFELRKREGSVQ